jgi:hypothetical protein
MLPELNQRFSENEIESAFEAVHDGTFDDPFDTAKANQMQVWLNSMPKYANTIADMHWQVWKAERQCYFLTSDAPAFVRRHAHDDDVGIVGITLADLNAELTLPITKKSLLIAKHTPCKSILRATKTRVRELNSLIVRMANKHVFAPDDSQDIRALEQFTSLLIRGVVKTIDENGATIYPISLAPKIPPRGQK